MTNVPAKPEPTDPQESSKPKSGLLATIAKVGPTLFVLAVMGGGWLAVHQINTGGQPEEEESAVEEAAAPDSLTLPEGKVKAAKFESVPAQMQAVEHVHTIPGRIRYDETKHVDVKAPMDGILAEVLVTPGEHVQSGQLLAVLRSPEIGQARAEMLKRQQEREIAQQMLQRELTLAKNLQQMSSMLDQGQSVDSIEAAFRNRALGSYRQDILSAFAKMQLASMTCSARSSRWPTRVRCLVERFASGKPNVKWRKLNSAPLAIKRPSQRIKPRSMPKPKSPRLIGN